MATFAACGDGAQQTATRPDALAWEPPPPEASIPVDRCAYGVAPFNVAGAAEGLRDLASGVPGLLQAALDRSRSAGVIAATETSEARREALDEGIANLVTGSVLGDVDHVIVRARRQRTRSGRVLGEELVQGSPDSLGALVTRLALRLAIDDMDPPTAAVIAETPLEAVESTLAGVQAYCRAMHGGVSYGLWAGVLTPEQQSELWTTAAERFDEALAADSTFGPAAFGFWAASSSPVSPYSNRAGEARRRAWATRDRLMAGSRAALELYDPPVAAGTTTGLEQLRVAEAAAAAYSENWGVWSHLNVPNLLGWTYYNWGAYLGVEDWPAKAVDAFRRLAELEDVDGGFSCMEAEVILVRLKDPSPDPELVRLARDQCMSGDSFWRLRWAALLGDSVELRTLRDTMRYEAPGPQIRLFARFWALAGIPLTDWDLALEAAEGTVSTLQDRRQLLGWGVQRALVAGRPDRASALVDSALDLGVRPWGMLAYPLQQAVVEPGWTEHAASARVRMFSYPDTLRYDPGGGFNNSFDRLCYAELSRLAERDTTSANRSIGTLIELREGEVPRRHRTCPEIAGAILEHLRPGSADSSVTTLDSLMRLGPLDDAVDQQVGNLILARIYAARGDTASAWEAVQRRIWGGSLAHVLPAWLRTEGLLAAAMGQHEQAVRAYRHYLLLRENPEPALVPQRDSVRAELEALVGREGLEGRSP